MRRHVGQLAMLIGLTCASAAQGSAPAARPATNAPRRIAGLADTAPQTSNPWRGSVAKPAVASGVAAPAVDHYAPLPIERQMRALSIDALGMPTVRRTRGAARVQIRPRGWNDNATDDWPGMAPPWARSSW